MAVIEDERVSLSREIPGVGRLDFEQTDKRRDYWLLPEGGQRRTRLTSVTSILRDTWPKTALFEWYMREGAGAKGILADAQARGKAVHHFIEAFMTDGTLLPFSDFDPAYRPWLQGAAKFMFEAGLEPVDTERLVCHPELHYAGRLDLLARTKADPRLTLWDFKTNAGGNVYAEAHVQTWAYALADFRCGGEPIERRAVVGLNNQGGYRIVESPDAEDLWGHCLSFHAAMKGFLRVLGEATS